MKHESWNMKHVFAGLALVLLGAGCARVAIPPAAPPVPASSDVPLGDVVDFSKVDPRFRFSADLVPGWETEFVPEITAIKIYGQDEVDYAFIRLFEADRFLTLTTVDILKREELTVNGHDAVKYEIKKKPGVPPFPNQPAWRNDAHTVLDIRFSKQSPTTFYVFAKNPALNEKMFDDFIQSIRFHNDPSAWRLPIDRAKERVTKKPFGIKVSPEDSPVSPERFSGYHTATDFEAFDDEQSREVVVSAACGGRLRVKTRTAGYGGVVVQDCIFGDEPVTAIYGHLDLASVKPKIGDYLAPGDAVGNLGDGFSTETDGERKHLHLGIHRGTDTDIRGYVARASDLGPWINPADLLF